MDAAEDATETNGSQREQQKFDTTAGKPVVAYLRWLKQPPRVPPQRTTLQLQLQQLLQLQCSLVWQHLHALRGVWVTVTI
jgi:hypothetical protein